MSILFVIQFMLCGVLRLAVNCQVIQGEGDQIVPGHRKTKVIIEMLREDADESDQLNFLLESLPYR
jgi:hypothetical protein